ncbi:MAG: APC family permease [bacterium]
MPSDPSEPAKRVQTGAIALPIPLLPPPALLKHSLRWSSLLCMVYVTVCAGPFGLEEMVPAVGPGMTFILLLLTPVFWGLPLLFMSAELSSALPLQGGMYQWVKTAFGDFWGFQAGWWWWVSSFLDCAIYAVLVADYFQFHFPQGGKIGHWGIALSVIWLFTYLNVRGIRVIGTSSVLFVLFMITPFILMIISGLPKITHNPFVPMLPPGKSFLEVLGTGLLMSIWFISGFEGLSTAAEEINNSGRALSRALLAVFPMILASYCLPILVSLAVDPTWAEWQAGHFSKIAEKVGGRFLGGWVSMAGVIANMALFGAWLLSYSRIPFAMANDGYLPKAITRISPKYGTPVTAIVLSGLIYSVFSYSDFKSLVLIDIWVILGAMFLEFLSLLKLRRTRPELPRHFRVPGGNWGLYFTVSCPIVIGLFAMFGSGVEYILPGLAAVCTGPAAFWICKKLVKERK